MKIITRKEATDTFDRGEELRHTFYGVSGCVGREEKHVVVLRASKWKYDEAGEPQLVCAEAIFDYAYKVRNITLEQVRTFIERHYAPEPKAMTFGELCANMGVCPTPTIEGDS